MPRTVEIEIFNIAKTRVVTSEVRRWLTHIGADSDAFMAAVPDDVTDPALVVALAAKRCYMSFEVGLNPNITKVRQDIVTYLDNILRQGHGSVLEHSVQSFAIEGVSRVFTAEMNRHRAGWAISEGSLRFIRFDKEIPFWMPESLMPQPGDDAELTSIKKDSRRVFMEAFRAQERAYEELLNMWNLDEGSKNFAYKKKVTSCLRRIVGMGVATGGVWTGNIRALRHVLAMRSSEAAEEEIFHVFSRVGEMMVRDEPMLFGDFSRTHAGGWAPTYPKV
jgi:thymidylate synthase (FAD)